MSTSKPRLVVLAVIILNFAIPVFSQTYYLDAVNGNDSNPGTSDQPWQSLTKAQSSLVPGDKVLLADGDYGEFITVPETPYSGEREDAIDDSTVQWITWEAMPGNNPVLDRVVFAESGGLCYLRYWFKNLKMRRIEFQNIVTFKMNDCEIVGPGDDIQYAYGGSVTIRSSSNIAINNCDIHFCSGTSVTITSSAHITIADCQIYDVGADHFTLRTEHSDCYNVRIIGNTMYNTLQWDPSAHPDGIQFYAASGNNFRECVFARNTMRSLGVQGLFIHGDNGRFIDGLIENNLIYGCGGNATNIANTYNTVIRNNTILGYASISASSELVQVYNNIIYGSYVLKDWVKGTEPHTYMYQQDQKETMLYELFNDPGNGDYSLRESCLAADYCPASPAPVNDKLDQTRDSMPDAGCYEYMGDTPPPSTPPDDDPPAEEPPAEEPPADDPPAEDPPADTNPGDDQIIDDSNDAQEDTPGYDNPWISRKVELVRTRIERENLRYNSRIERMNSLRDRVQNRNMRRSMKTRILARIDSSIESIEQAYEQKIETYQQSLVELTGSEDPNPE